MNQLRFFVSANFGQNTWRLGIDRETPESFFGLAKIDIGERSRVNQNIELKIADLSVISSALGEIKLLVIEPDQVEFFAIGAHERMPKTTARTDDYNFHSSVAALCERRPKYFRRS